MSALTGEEQNHDYPGRIRSVLPDVLRRYREKRLKSRCHIAVYLHICRLQASGKHYVISTWTRKRHSAPPCRPISVSVHIPGAFLEHPISQSDSVYTYSVRMTSSISHQSRYQEEQIDPDSTSAGPPLYQRTSAGPPLYHRISGPPEM